MAAGSESILAADGGEAAVAYEERGDGEPVLLVHAGLLSGWFLPVSRSAQLEGFRVVRLRRAGYVPGRPPARHLSIADHAHHCAAVIDALGLGGVHFVGHSSSCLIGLQLALDRPEAVRSLVLLEPAPGGALHGPADEQLVATVLGPAMRAFASGDLKAAFDTFMRGVGGDGYREWLELRLGAGGWEKAVAESAFFFADEARAVQEWSFGAAEASRVGQPALVVLGGESARQTLVFDETVERLTALLPQPRMLRLPGVNHMMPLQDPGAVAGTIAEFARAQTRAGVAGPA